ncbi:MAG: lipocalin family protein [bacterium]|nr:lipocalin family protein [bacterium]
MPNPPTPIVFPSDEQSHDATIEWWYWNGHLRDASGNRYSFTNCLFRADVAKAKIPFLKSLPLQSHMPHAYFAHAVLSNITKQTALKDAQHVVFISRESFGNPLLYVSYHDPLTRHEVPTEITETAPFTYQLKSKNLNLSLVSQKQPLLEAGTGFISVAGRESYYYSLTDLRVTGSILVDGNWIAIEGKAWMDHQWANVPYARDRWNWFSLQLHDGIDLMCVEYQNGEKKEGLVDVLRPDGTSAHYTQLTLTPGTDIWKSPRTNAEYPLSWDISIPDAAIRLSAHAPLADEELLLAGMNYWEGPVDVSGTIGEKTVSGAGFMELVGYPADYSRLNALISEVRGKIRSLLG